MLLVHVDRRKQIAHLITQSLADTVDHRVQRIEHDRARRFECFASNEPMLRITASRQVSGRLDVELARLLSLL